MKILAAEDEKLLGESIGTVLESNDYDVDLEIYGDSGLAYEELGIEDTTAHKYQGGEQETIVLTTVDQV